MKYHSQNTLEVIQAAFPPSLADDVSEVMRVIPITKSEPHSDNSFTANIEAGVVTIPNRVYFPEIPASNLKNLTVTQNAILAAIFSLHYSGYQREIWAERLTCYPSVWSTPFLALLFRDYVQEVLAALEQKINDDWTVLIHEFAIKNPDWRRPLNHQILNYWAIYYRQKIPRLTDYPGYKLAARLGIWDKKTAPKLTRAKA